VTFVEARASREVREEIAAHRAPLERDWSIWRTAMVRGAGFPAAMLDAIAAPELVAAIANLFEREDAYRRETERAIAALEQAIEHVVGDARKPIGKALRKLRNGQVPDLPADVAPEVSGTLDAVRLEQRALTATREEVHRVLNDAMARCSTALQAVAGDDTFREAVVWQNPGAVHTALDRVRDGRASSPSQHRQHEHLVARYLQRYCAKNESIGFFGPIGWASIIPDGATRVRPGANLIADGGVYFEHWSLDALAHRIAQDDEVRPQLAPRLLATVQVEGTQLRYGATGIVELPEIAAAILAQCDGERTAQQIANHFEPAGEVGADEVYELLEELQDRGLITWTLELPSGTRRTELELIAIVERTITGAARDRALEMIRRLVDARDRVTTAGHQPDTLARALEELQTVFVDLTAMPATRRAGEAYAGRTLVYSDYRRDIDVTLGASVIEPLQPVLVPVLDSVRWYTYEIGRRYRARLLEAFEEISSERTVSYLQLWERVSPWFPNHPWQRSEIVEEVLGLLQATWREVFELAGDHRRIELSATTLRARIGERFAAPHAGWPTARHCSPDVMIAARDAAAIERREHHYVLGELHIGNTLMSTCFLQQHPDLEVLVEACAQDIGIGVAPVEAKHLVTRADRVSRSPRDFHLEIGPSRSWRPRAQVVRAADLVVVHTDDNRLEVRDTRQGHRFDLIAFLDQYLTFSSSSHFKLVSSARHVPRVTVDRVVLVREQWVHDADELTFARSERVEDRFVGTRRWAERHGFPRWIFVKVPHERKPVFVDLTSPVLVEILNRLLRQATSATITEMLPDLTELWLPDARQQTYTAELRMVAFDSCQWSPTNT
jgi:hypothetical protein